jgi:hypothetical protein
MHKFSMYMLQGGKFRHPNKEYGQQSMKSLANKKEMFGAITNTDLLHYFCSVRE